MTLKKAQEYAGSINLNLVCPDTLLAAILDEGLLSVKILFESFDIDLKSLQMISALYLINKDQAVADQTVTKKVLGEAKRLAKSFDSEDLFESAEFILLALADLIEEELPYLYRYIEEERTGFLEEWRKTLISFIKDEPINEFSFFKNYDEDEGESLTYNREEFQEPFESNKILEEFATNLNKKAYAGEFDGLVSYDNTLDRLYTTLCREKKKNAIITGIAGIGKTSILEILAREIVEGNAPDLLKDKVIYDVHLADMISGAIWRGQFEKRLCGFIEEAKRKKNVVLFFDEIHTLVGAGTGGKSDDLEASNILKPALARGEISCIGATTPTEYDSKIKSDPALDRRFQQVPMYPPNSTQMKEILPHIIEYYASLHPVEYSDEFVEEVIAFCDRELPNKSYPDKLVDVIDFCGARAKMEYFVVPLDIKKLEKVLLDDDNGLTEEEINKRIAELNDEYIRWGDEIKDTKAPVTIEHLKFYLKENVLTLLSKELQKEFFERLKNNIINQVNVDEFNSAMHSVNFKTDSSPNIILVYGDKKSGKSFFIKTVGDCLRNCGCETITVTKFGLIPESILGVRNSLAKKLSYHENPVVILDDYDMVDQKAVNILNDAIKTGFFETFDGERIDISSVTFILSASGSIGSMGFEKGGVKPNVSKDILELAQLVRLENPTDKNKEKYLEYRIKELDRDLARQDVKLKNWMAAQVIIGGTLGGYGEINSAFRQKIMPIVIKAMANGEKVVDLLKK